MRWLPWGVIVGLLLGLGWLWTHPRPLRTGWALACHGAPHQRLTETIEAGLRHAGLVIGLRGWQPTVAWVNEQCAVMAQTERVH